MGVPADELPRETSMDYADAESQWDVLKSMVPGYKESRPREPTFEEMMELRRQDMQDMTKALMGTFWRQETDEPKNEAMNIKLNDMTSSGSRSRAGSQLGGSMAAMAGPTRDLTGSGPTRGARAVRCAASTNLTLELSLGDR